MSLDRRNRQKRQQSRKLLLIVDGESERTYFEYFVGKNRNLKVEIKPSKNQSSYKRTLEYCLKQMKIYDIDMDKGDRVAIVTDVDDHPDSEVIFIESQCRKKEIELYISNPCFEVWLVLHYERIQRWMQRGELNDRLSELMEKKYVKADGIPLSQEMVGIALKNGLAQTQNGDLTNQMCLNAHNSSTTVYRLVDTIVNTRT